MKQPRSTRRVLTSMVLAFQSLVVFFATLVGFGLKVYPDPRWIWGVGLGLSVLLILTPGVLGRPGSYIWGAALQVATIAIGFWVPLMFLVGAIFAGLWIWGMIAGGIIDRARAAWEAQQEREGGND